VILYSGQLEIGVWTIHVIALLMPGLLDKVTFSAVVRGSLETPELTDERTVKCVDCGSGTCDDTTGVCVCDRTTYWQSCQFTILQVVPDIPQSITVSSSGNVFLSLTKPASVSGNLTVILNIIDDRSRNIYPVLHLFISEGRPPDAFPRDYESQAWALDRFVQTFEHRESDGDVDGILIHNLL
jgi:hypothetical protein